MRLRVDLVLQVDDEKAVTGAALARIADDGDMTDDERLPARNTVNEDAAEALAYLVDPFNLVGDVPGVELQQASWSSEQIDYDPDSPEWDLDEGDAYELYDMSDKSDDRGERDDAGNSGN